MKLLFACGGTGGHINPALAVANYARSQDASTEILFAGNPDGMEARLVKEAGYDFASIRVRGLQRRFSLRNIGNNIMAAVYLTTAGARAKKIIKGFDPDVVIGTGGYVSWPIMNKAAELGYKTLSHEQNAFPGMTQKMLAKKVSRMLVAFPEAIARFPEGIDFGVVGNPVREEIIFADRAKAREKFGIGDRICILSYGGSLGAQRINETVADVMGSLWKEDGKYYFIHATGRYGTEDFPKMLDKYGIKADREKGLYVREYINDMADCMAAADLLICRSGAITLSELEAAGVPSILIPSPNVAENHQYFNAKVLADKEAALLIEEKDLSGEKLTEAVKKLTDDRDTLAKYAKNAQKLAILDSNKLIYNEILKLAGEAK
ncbi:MAG: undecaprenyldiphospho-muramoylpentapeptide beta-N-acetylglucosaminyltransferase [Oscillospiraceae bacterium]|nr:undecaprenyldiphospho-muramoylpentapeptide beta-N-acetylglucosaminyltransferase [Oscillospiraceae bacterium]